ncbi:hypothetical protein KPL71_021832 [Citrus sinensis]|uniref:Uncharacterized protein n=1 Tax=Citrus sinensis TaxID=2711 RepID=A0ACB8JIV8_CITSI|nr:hypothetical protein KPL71_021832 [Citrus sinensis]
MVDAIVSPLLEQLISISYEEAKQQVRLVTGVKKQVKKLTSNLRTIQAVLNDAEQRQVKEKSVRLWLDQLKEASYDMEDVLDEWITARLKLRIDQAPAPKKPVCSFLLSPCIGVKQVFLRRDIAQKIKEINENLDDIARQKDMFNFRVRLTYVQRMGGIGKTTLAQFAYNDKDVIDSFEKRIWVCVSDPFDEFRIAKAIVEDLGGSVRDLEDYNKWEPFRYSLMNGLHGSKILVTTRKETVAHMMESADVISIKELSEQECLSLFKRFAFANRPLSECEKLEEISRKIVGKCKGLPLAAKTLGSLLRFKRNREEWQSILDSQMWQLEEFEKGLLAPLLLSYNDLPPTIKCCFTFCAIFPKDYTLHKDELVKLWMAQGYIGQKENMEMEMIAEGYFDYLATRSLFQEFQRDEEGIVKRCKMHDIVHDFALFLNKKECAAVEVEGVEEPLLLINTCPEKLRHLMLVLGYEAPSLVSIFNAIKLRSLILFYWIPNLDAMLPVLKGIFDQLTCLRALRIEGTDNWELEEDQTNEILNGVEKLIHLRYLKLNLVGDLPEKCCELLNLQTLELENSSHFKRFPQGIGKLINLRHLIFTEDLLEYMPKGIEKLTSLRTLSEFVVASGGGRYGSEACKLEGLRHLNHLRGSLTVRGLGNVADVDEVKNAHLEKKKNLVRLILRFKDTDEAVKGWPEAISNENAAKHEAICEALWPPPNLESLEIAGFRGRKMMLSTNWMASLNMLKKLRLLNCPTCEIMPPLGQLPSLEILLIKDMTSVERVGDESLGIANGDHGAPSSSSVNNIAFPKLKELEFSGLQEWEDWDFRKEDITIMPQINSLSIYGCHKLKSLPDQLLQSSTLKTLRINRCRVLEEHFKKDRSKISHIPDIQIYERGPGFFTLMARRLMNREAHGWQLITAAVVVCGMHGSCNVTNLSVCRTMINPVTVERPPDSSLFGLSEQLMSLVVNSDDIAFGGRHTSDMNLAEAKVLDIDFIAEIYDHD